MWGCSPRNEDSLNFGCNKYSTTTASATVLAFHRHAHRSAIVTAFFA
jgi:hypothetical protein